jgi:hypothetical protein
VNLANNGKIVDQKSPHVDHVKDIDLDTQVREDIDLVYTQVREDIDLVYTQVREDIDLVYTQVSGCIYIMAYTSWHIRR